MFLQKSRRSLELWVGCVAGALSDYDYVAKLAKAGFENIEIEPTRVYRIEDARTFLSVKASMSTHWLKKWKANSLVPLSGRKSLQQCVVLRSKLLFLKSQ